MMSFPVKSCMNFVLDGYEFDVIIGGKAIWLGFQLASWLKKFIF